MDGIVVGAEGGVDERDPMNPRFSDLLGFGSTRRYLERNDRADMEKSYSDSRVLKTIGIACLLGAYEFGSYVSTVMVAGEILRGFV